MAAATVEQAATASAEAREEGRRRRDAGDLDGARTSLAQALAHARRARDPVLEGQVRLTLAGLHIVEGDLLRARREARRAGVHADATDRARLGVQLSVAEERAGRLTEAVEGCTMAEAVLVAAGDDLWVARARINRSVALAQLGRMAEARHDLERAGACPALAGPALAVVALNQAWVAALAGEPFAALGGYEAAAVLAEAAGLGTGLVDRDRATLLADLGLWADAAIAAERAIADLERRSPLYAPEARLVLAVALVGADRPEAAAGPAAAAAAAFARQGRAVWVVRAGVVRLAAALAAGGAEPADAAEAVDLADQLGRAGMAVERTEARALAARLALACARPVPPAVLPLVPVTGPPWTRARVWLAEAERRRAGGDTAGARRAAGAGLDALDSVRSGPAWLEVRAGVAAAGAALAALGLELAATGGARQLLRWAERQAGPPPTRPPTDPALLDGLAALRAAGQRAAAAEDGADAAAAHRLLRGAEAAVRRRSLALGSGAQRSTAADTSTRPDAKALSALLGPQVLIRYVVLGPRLDVVVVAGGRARRFTVGALGEIVASLDRLRFAVIQIGAGGARGARAVPAATRAAGEVGAILLGPLRRVIGSAPLVVVPAGPLHAVPWAMLPDLWGRTVAVAPSVRSWAARPPGDAVGGLAVFASGPGLADAAQEVEAAAAAWTAAGHPAVRIPLASAADLLAAADGATVLHVAAHGRFRTDNPLLSSLLLADGPLNAHDLLRWQVAPATVVLGACELGTSVAAAAGEVLGMVSAFLAVGTAVVVAPLVPVPDEHTVHLVAATVAGLAAGAGPAAALAAATAAVVAAGDPVATATARSFCAFGVA